MSTIAELTKNVLNSIILLIFTVVAVVGLVTELGAQKPAVAFLIDI